MEAADTGRGQDHLIYQISEVTETYYFCECGQGSTA